MALLYEDWLQTEGDWSKSSIHYNSLEKSKFKKRGKYVYMCFKDVEEKYGSSIAKGIRKSKMELEETRGENEEPWYCKHPEVDDEASCF